MSEESRSRKIEEWIQRLLRFSNCSQTVVEFCRSEGVSQPSFYAWRKKLKAIGLGTVVEPQYQSASPKAAKSVRPRSSSSFESVSLDPHPVGIACLKVRLAGGIELELGDDPNVIQAVVKQLVESTLQTGGPQPC